MVFRADASSLIGSGHVMRCLTLAQRLHKEENAKVVFIMRRLSGNLIDLVRKQGFDVLVLPPADQNYELGGYGLWLGSRPVGLSSGKCDFMGTVHTAGNRDPAPAQSGARVSFLRRLFYSTSS